MNTLESWGKWWLWVPTVTMEGSLPNSFGAKFMLFINTYFYGGALTSHIMGEHSPPKSIFPFLVTYSDPLIWAAVGTFGVQRVTFVQS